MVRPKVEHLLTLYKEQQPPALLTACSGNEGAVVESRTTPCSSESKILRAGTRIPVRSDSQPGKVARPASVSS